MPATTKANARYTTKQTRTSLYVDSNPPTPGGRRSRNSFGNADLKHWTFGEVDAEEILWDQSPRRKQVAQLMCSVPCKIFTAITIVVSIFLAIYEADIGAQEKEFDPWFSPTLHALSLWYLVELTLRLYISGPKFFSDSSNVFDFSLVVMDTIFGALEAITGGGPQVPALRLFRLVRVLRMIRLLTIFRPLYMMLHGLVSVMQAIFWATLILFASLIILAIAATILLHPVVVDMIEDGYDFSSCARCSHAYSSVFSSFLSLLQTVVIGETFTEFTLIVVEKSMWALVIYVMAHIVVQLGVTNLILAVIVDQARMARERDSEQKLLEKELEKQDAKTRLQNICLTLDSDQSGSITLDELLSNVDVSQEFVDVLKLMDIEKHDLSVVFSILDQDKSGEVSYNEFVEELYKMKSEDAHTLLILIRHYVLEIKDQLTNQINHMEMVFKEVATELLQKKGVQSTELKLLSQLSSGPGTPKSARTSAFTDVGESSQTILESSLSKGSKGSKKISSEEPTQKQHRQLSDVGGARSNTESLQLLGEWMTELSISRLNHLQAACGREAAEDTGVSGMLTRDPETVSLLGVAAVLESVADMAKGLAAHTANAYEWNSDNPTSPASCGMSLGGEPQGDQTSRITSKQKVL